MQVNPKSAAHKLFKNLEPGRVFMIKGDKDHRVFIKSTGYNPEKGTYTGVDLETGQAHAFDGNVEIIKKEAEVYVEF